MLEAELKDQSPASEDDEDYFAAAISDEFFEQNFADHLWVRPPLHLLSGGHHTQGSISTTKGHFPQAWQVVSMSYATLEARISITKTGRKRRDRKSSVRKKQILVVDGTAQVLMVQNETQGFQSSVNGTITGLPTGRVEEQSMNPKPSHLINYPYPRKEPLARKEKQQNYKGSSKHSNQRYPNRRRFSQDLSPTPSQPPIYPQAPSQQRLPPRESGSVCWQRRDPYTFGASYRCAHNAVHTSPHPPSAIS
ncbi:hypothetical protein BDR22DRAFT_916782 [Usnea florida]